MKTKTWYAVIYYAGGAEVGEWHYTSYAYEDRSVARSVADQIERAGRPTLIHDADQLAKIGLPEGPPNWWDFTNLCRKKPGAPDAPWTPATLLRMIDAAFL